MGTKAEKGWKLARSIRVISGNLWWGKADPDGLVDLIREHQVDVFATQEMGLENAEAIATELPFGTLEPDETFQGMGIALRRPAKYERIPLPFRDARRVVQGGDAEEPRRDGPQRQARH